MTNLHVLTSACIDGDVSCPHYCAPYMAFLTEEQEQEYNKLHHTTNDVSVAVLPLCGNNPGACDRQRSINVADVLAELQEEVTR